eukprot:6188608-Pleurochrysis_carterae.AAC.1
MHQLDARGHGGLWAGDIDPVSPLRLQQLLRFVRWFLMATAVSFAAPLEALVPSCCHRRAQFRELRAQT